MHQCNVGAFVHPCNGAFHEARVNAPTHQRTNATLVHSCIRALVHFMKPTILIVDDEPGVRASLSGVLGDEGYSVDTVSSGEECLERVTRAAFDLIVLDVWLPGMDGLATLARLRERQVDSQVVLISGHGNIESAVRAIKLGAFDFVEKPLSLEKTVLVIRNALRQRRLEAE